MDNQHVGTIATWIFSKGYGFISCVENGVQMKYYLHISRLKGTPAVEANVKFDVLPKREGPSPSAVNAEIIEPTCEVRRDS
jgi:cold shock CspA family protein